MLFISINISEDLIFNTQKFNKIYFGAQRIQTDRLESCIFEVNQWFQTAVRALYIRNYADPTQKPVVLGMIENLRKSFRKLLQENSWMDNITKRLALEKVCYNDKYFKLKLIFVDSYRPIQC